MVRWEVRSAENTPDNDSSPTGKYKQLPGLGEGGTLKALFAENCVAVFEPAALTPL